MSDTSNLSEKVKTATKWSAIAELAAKLVLPITSMVLARLLTPEAFGIVATLTMIVTFAEIFTDAGFQKYLIQHDFTDEIDKDESTNVAFWSNLVMSLVIWGIIAIFADPLATLVGNPGLGYVLVIACASIPLAAFSSIQMALYKRDLDFKTLFKVRIVGVLVPLLITIPLAYILRSFWALVIGTLSQNIINAILLTAYSKWHPRFFYSIAKLKEMLSFTIWSMFEAISIWMTSYVDVFIVGTLLSQYYLGLYKTTSSLVGQVMGLITATTTPVLFSALSKLQNDKKEFAALFYNFQRAISILIIPIGVVLFCFSQQITTLVLGDKWAEASDFVGLWGLTSALVILYGSNMGEVYRAMGKPKVSVLVQWLHIIVLLPVVYFSAKVDFSCLSIARSVVRFEAILVNLIAAYYVANLSFAKMIKHTAPALISGLAMLVCSMILIMVLPHNLFVFFAELVVSFAVYFAMLLLFPSSRNTIEHTIKKYIRR